MIQHNMVMQDQVSVNNPDPNNAAWEMCGPKTCTGTTTMTTVQPNAGNSNVLDITPSSNALVGTQSVSITCKLTNYPTITKTVTLQVVVGSCVVTGVTKSGTTSNAV
jgi:hypothetical protein